METRKNYAEASLLTFDPIVLIQDVAKRWLAVVLAALVLGVGAYIKTDLSYTPVYQTTTTFVVTNRGSSSTVYSNLSSTTSLASVFTELLNSSILRKAILEEMGAQSFDGTISASVVPETNLLTVTVTASDPRTAFLVAQAIIDHHETVTYRIISGVVLEVLQSPTVPRSPINRADAAGQMKKFLVIGALGAIVLLAVISFCRDAVRSGREAREKLDCNFLGEIPHEKKRMSLLSRLKGKKSGILITNPVTSFHYVETIRKLRRRVEQHMPNGNVLMVTSLMENEGKSTIAANLALTFAQKHRQVLLIDCDMRKPACHTVLEENDFSHGLVDLLTGEAPPSECLIHYKKTNLYLLLDKHGSSSSSDLITCDNMQELIRWARAQFDFVILDLPPMSGVSDAESMAEYADACLLVVRQNTATAPAINKAIASLEGSKSKLLGCILNNVYSTSLFSGQGHNYSGYDKYNHYGSYHHYGAKTPNSSTK